MATQAVKANLSRPGELKILVAPGTAKLLERRLIPGGMPKIILVLSPTIQ